MLPMAQLLVTLAVEAWGLVARYSTNLLAKGRVKGIALTNGATSSVVSIAMVM
tara:strand:+ start:746 stop:904 length:159 start_codon:yes stop_codon:yes gene_type:complete